ncbi:hypothetical protein ARMGADRAFT_295257 [Armillaria gallica]|uniref:Secreted protein n=1 Tax=Armillaria gallica TaxID=47427 RepID=A0A2H3DAN6_ARMGA|nr:hypothetical protein ARMGADRAFT_295257 [Armillaria gallica]
MALTGLMSMLLHILAAVRAIDGQCYKAPGLFVDFSVDVTTSTTSIFQGARVIPLRPLDQAHRMPPSLLSPLLHQAFSSLTRSHDLFIDLIPRPCIALTVSSRLFSALFMPFIHRFVRHVSHLCMAIVCLLESSRAQWRACVSFLFIILDILVANM